MTTYQQPEDLGRFVGYPGNTLTLVLNFGTTALPTDAVLSVSYRSGGAAITDLAPTWSAQPANVAHIVFSPAQTAKLSGIDYWLTIAYGGTTVRQVAVVTAQRSANGGVAGDVAESVTLSAKVIEATTAAQTATTKAAEATTALQTIQGYTFGAEVATYAAMLALPTPPAKLCLTVYVANDENKGSSGSLYTIFPSGKRVWCAALADN